MYTPHVAAIIAETSPQTDDPHVELPENLMLHLPSSLPKSVHTLSEMKRICNMERRLRYAQAHDSLAQIRRQRRIIQGLWQFKKINVSGTGNRPNTRILSTYKRLSHKITRYAQKYRTARNALLLLDPDGDWREELKELRQEDIRGPGRDPDESNGRFVMSWIWMTRKADKICETTQAEAEFNECMRIEWTKSRARMMRWQEEFAIIQEEMRRVIAWFEWKGTWWEQQAMRRENANLKPDVLSGISAYAYKQANITRSMAICCANEWLPVLKSKQIKPAWAANYATQKTQQKMVVSPNDLEPDVDEAEALESDDGLDVEEISSDIEDLDCEHGDEIFFDYDD